ncbi:MAG TPA: hypothetical protein VMZ52_07520 [Bryobacteraceae bacterium]|nr:hypothetical protein [Bryobacteraceae bacterium]
MKLLLALLVSLAGAGHIEAQRHKPGTIIIGTPEGKLLQSIAQENDPATKLPLLEQFASEFPKHAASGWVASQAQAAYIKTGGFDKATQAGEKLLAADAEDIDAAYGNLKASEGKKDRAGILKWSAETSKIARRAVEAPKPADASEQEAWTQAVDFARQVDTYTEYAVYALALQATEPPVIMEAVEALEARNPQSQYLVQLLGKYAAAARQGNAMPRAITLGERAYARNQFDEDMLLAMADSYMQRNKEPDKVLLYATKTIDLLAAKPKPEGMADADWDKKKVSVTGLANWMAGVTYSGQEKYAQADKSLRAALPAVKDNDQLRGGALFHLGLVNYKMGRTSKNKTQIADAVKFSEQAAAMKGPYQAQSAKNVTVIKKEFALK